MVPRHRFRVARSLACVLLPPAIVVACDGGLFDATGSGDLDASAPSVPPDAALSYEDANAPVARVRLAQLARGLGAIDFCYASANTTSFEGPVLGEGIVRRKDAGTTDPDGETSADASADASSEQDAGTHALAYGEVTRPLGLPKAGPITIALVAPGATSCADKLSSNNVTIDPGKTTTLAILGDADVDGGPQALTIVAFTEDPSTVVDKARVRLVNALVRSTNDESPRPIFVKAVGTPTTVLADVVEPRKRSSPSMAIPIDELGYATVAARPDPAALAIGDALPLVDGGSPTSWTSEPTALELTAGSLHTGYVVSTESASFGVVWCDDTTVVGDRTRCTRVR